MGFLLQTAVFAMIVCSAKVSADVKVNYDTYVFQQVATQVQNEERSAMEAENAELVNQQNVCQQKSESAYKSCYGCIMKSCYMCSVVEGCHVRRGCRSCPYCRNFLDSNNKLLSLDEIKKFCVYKYLDQRKESNARYERLKRYQQRLVKYGYTVLQQLWTNGNRVSKLVILEENGSHKTSHVQKTITYDAANPRPAFRAIARLILNQEY